MHINVFSINYEPDVERKRHNRPVFPAVWPRIHSRQNIVWFPKANVLQSKCLAKEDFQRSDELSEAPNLCFSPSICP